MSSRTFTEPNRSTKPVRPTLLNLDLASNFAVQNGIVWTVADKKLALREFNIPGSGEFMDEGGHASIDGNDDIALDEGLWYIRFSPRLSKTGAGQEDVHLAITNADGTTVHREVGPLSHGTANPSHRQEVLEHFLDVPAAGAVVSFRAGQGTAGTDFTLDASFVGYVQRVIPQGKLDKE